MRLTKQILKTIRVLRDSHGEVVILSSAVGGTGFIRAYKPVLLIRGKSTAGVTR